MPSVIRPEVLAMQAYHVPDASGCIKLDAMENPWSWPVSLHEDWCAALREAEINRYPDPIAGDLTQALRSHLALPEDMALMLGNGSDELIQILQMAVARPSAVIMSPTPTFVMYEVIAQWLGLKFVGVPLAEDFSLDMAAMETAIRRHSPAVLFIAWPNNPTGTLYPREQIEALIEMSPGLVVVDEAYHPFAQTSMLEYLPNHPRLLVMRTLSKAGFAGLRLGMLAGAPSWLREFDKLRLPYNINVLTQISARFALAHWRVFEEQSAQLREQREMLFSAMLSIGGVEVWPSRANFILFRVKNADFVHNELKGRGILIKNLNRSSGPLMDCLRVTVGAPHENQAFLSALKESLQ